MAFLWMMVFIGITPNTNYHPKEATAVTKTAKR
jgi:hypothetical protein